MQGGPTPIVRALIGIVVMSMIMSAVALAGAGFATAHTALTGSDPAAGATAPSAPTAITLTFNQDISASFASVVVSGADGRNWVSGAPQVNGAQLRAVVDPGLPAAAAYTVAYRVVSSDGHPVAGSFGFTVARPPGAAARPVPPSATQQSPTASSSPPASESNTGAWILTAAVAGLLAGGVIALWRRRRHNRADQDDGEPAPG